MMPKNKYIIRSRISEAKFREIVKYFSLDLEATQISKLSGISRISINKYLKQIRIKIAQYCESESPFEGEVEVDESYFGAKRVKGKRGRGASGKTIVFGLLKRHGKVYTEIVPNCARATLQSIIKGKVSPETVVHSDGWRGYNGLVDLGYKKHCRVDHGSNEFVRGNSHINGIESFWGFAKTRISKFRGMNKNLFYFHLKECEFRFNYRDKNIYAKLLKIFKKDPLKLS
jgi:transposase-like protein